MLNATLRKAQEVIDGGLGSEEQVVCQFITRWAWRTAYHGGPFSLLASLKRSREPVGDAVIFAVNLSELVGVLAEEEFPQAVKAAAAESLLLHILDFMQVAGVISPITDPGLAYAHDQLRTIHQDYAVRATPEQMLHDIEGGFNGRLN